MSTLPDPSPAAPSRPPHGQPLDYFELEQHRLFNLANSMTLAITEGFGDYVDAREWQQDDPSFGFGRVGAPLLYTSIHDRDDGKYLPVFQTQLDLAAIRAEARNVTATSGGVVGAIGTLSNYTFGGGFKFTVQRAASCPPGLSQDAIQHLVTEAQSVIDRFLHENRFQSDLDREIDARSREDGEAFVELSLSPAGQIRASFDEPDMICQPSNPGPIEEWLREQDPHRYSSEWNWSWSFGVHSVRRTPDDPLGYHVVYDTAGDDWEYIPASRMLHVKRNVPRNVKRGVSDLYWIANDVQREAKIRRNTADGAALQAAIAWFREHAQGTTAAAVQGLVSGQSIDTRQQRTATGTRPTRQGRLRSGTVVDIPESMKVLPGPMGSERNANFILIAQYVARAIAQRWAMPEFMFTSDASNANYASTLVAESPFVKARETDQRFYSHAFVELLWKVLRLSHEIGRAFRKIQNFAELQKFLEITATGPRVSNRDELQTVQRQQIEIELGTLSLETAAAEMGRDLAKEKAKGAKGSQQDEGSSETPDADGSTHQTESQRDEQATTSSVVNEAVRDRKEKPDTKPSPASLAECCDGHGNTSGFKRKTDQLVPSGSEDELQNVITLLSRLLEVLAGNMTSGMTRDQLRQLQQQVGEQVETPQFRTAFHPVQEAEDRPQRPRYRRFSKPIVECGGKGGNPGPCPTSIAKAPVGKKPKKSKPSASTVSDAVLQPSVTASPRSPRKKPTPAATPPPQTSKPRLPRQAPPNISLTSRTFKDHNGNPVVTGFKPKHSPSPAKWYRNGGTITVDKDGTWTYHDWEQNSVSYPRGYPDFTTANLVVVDVNLRFEGNHSSDFTKANKKLKNPPLPSGLTWHHHEDGRMMQAIETRHHERFTHSGGVSLSKKRKRAQTIP